MLKLADPCHRITQDGILLYCLGKEAGIIIALRFLISNFLFSEVISMPIPFNILRLSNDNFHPQQLAHLAKTSAQEGFDYVQRFCANWENGNNRFDRPGEAFFAAVFEDKILGIGGRNIDPYSNNPGIARVRRMYISPEWRHIRMGSKILENILDVPAGMFHKITVRTMNPAARKFYEYHGFCYVGEGEVTHEREF